MARRSSDLSGGPEPGFRGEITSRRTHENPEKGVFWDENVIKTEQKQVKKGVFHPFLAFLSGFEGIEDLGEAVPDPGEI